MFCPKCGTQNPDDGRFCRSCGGGLSVVSTALGKSNPAPYSPLSLTDRKGRPISWEGALTSLFTGIAFLAISIALSLSPVGRTWWFWLLIPAFSMIATGMGRIIRLRANHQSLLPPKASDPADTQGNTLDAKEPEATSLPPAQTEFMAPPRGSIYETGELVERPSVVENTTRHLEVDKENETMTLPKR